MIRKTCSFFLKLDSNDERHRRYRRDARTLANVRGNLKCWPFFPGTLRYIADKTQIATPPGMRPAVFQEIGLHGDNLVPAVPFAGEHLLKSIRPEPDGAVDEAVLDSNRSPRRQKQRAVAYCPLKNGKICGI